MPRMLHVRLFGAAGALAAAAGGLWSLRMAQAGWLARQNTAAALERAAACTPDDSRLYRRLAVLREREGAPAAAVRAALEKAAVVNPRDSAALMELGLAAEMAGDRGEAERRFLAAARVDRQFDPAWTLANHYFRRGDAGHFWVWANRAAAMCPHDGIALYRLCREVSPDASEILARAVPDSPDALARYLTFLVRDGHTEGIEEPARRLAGRTGRERLPLLLAACDRLLSGDAPRVDAAVRLWSILGSRGLTPYRPGEAIVNAEFRHPPLSRGFDWRMHERQGIQFSQTTASGGLRITLSGRQPERCEILSQYVPVEPGRRYRLRTRYRTAGIAPGTGLRWRVHDPAENAELGSTPDLSNEGGGFEEATFTARGRLARMALVYRRALGTTRVEGAVHLSSVELMAP